MSAASTGAVTSNCVNIEKYNKTFLQVTVDSFVQGSYLKEGVRQQQRSFNIQIIHLPGAMAFYLTVLAGDRVPVALIFSPASALLEKCSLFSVLEMRGPSTARPVVTELGL